MRKRILRLLVVIVCIAVCLPASSMAEDLTPIQHFLLLGFDYWGDKEIGTSWSDTNIILSLDFQQNRIMITSIARDSYLKLPDGTYSRINSIVREHDFDTYVAAVEANFEIEATAYVAIGSPGFARMIGAMGGLELTITQEEYDALVKLDFAEGISGPGTQTLRGNAVLRYVRNRSTDGHELARTKRARNVMEACLTQLMEKPLGELVVLANTAINEVKTDLNLDEVLLLISSVYKMGDMQITEMRMPVSGGFTNETIHGASCMVYDWDKNLAAFQSFLTDSTQLPGE